jgi:ribonuclease Z
LEIVFLGTSAAVPSRQRNLPSIALLYNGEQLLFDAGEDVQRRFEDAGLKFNAPLSIFITHMHGDHVIGLPGLLFHFTLISRMEDVRIWGPPGLFAYLYMHRIVSGLRAPFLHDVFEIHLEENMLYRYDFQGTVNTQPEKIPITRNIIHETNLYIIRALSVCHSVPTTGFRFQEKPLPGRFNPEIASELKIPQGNLWKKMQLGKTIIYNGKSYNPQELGIVGPKRQGKIIAYTGDTKYCKNLKKLAKDADVLICEATFGTELKDLAEEKSHMTANQAATLAKKSQVSQLILTHISTRYANEHDLSELLKEARSIFPNSLIAYDLMRIKPTNEASFNPK